MKFLLSILMAGNWTRWPETGQLTSFATNGIINRAAEGGRGSRIAFGFFKPRSRRLGGFLLCLRFIFFNRAAEGGRGSRTAFGFFKPRSRRLGGFLLCLRFFFFFSF